MWEQKYIDGHRQLHGLYWSGGLARQEQLLDLVTGPGRVFLTRLAGFLVSMHVSSIINHKSDVSMHGDENVPSDLRRVLYVVVS